MCNSKNNELGTQPRYVHLADAIKSFINEQKLRPGSKLPGGRFFAAKFKAGKNTIYEAFELLQNENVVEVRKDSGTYIARQALYDLVSCMPNWNNYLRSGWQQESSHLAYLSRAASDKNNIYLGLAALHQDFGYQQMFRNALMAVCNDESRFSRINEYNVLGAESLRNEIARRLKLDGICVNSSNIAVTWGTMSSLDMLIKALLGRGDTIYTESPSCITSLTLASSIGVNIVNLSLDDEGIDINRLKKHTRQSRRAVLVVSPDGGGPEGKITSSKRRKALMNHCSFADLPVIEIGKNIHLARSNLMPLKALDKDNRVIYIDSIMLPYSLGMDISWIAAPDYLIDRITDISTQTCHYPFNLNNMAVEKMLSDGSYDKFVSTLAPLITERLKLTDKLLEKYMLNYAEWDRSCTKSSFWLRMNDNISVKKMITESLHYGVIPISGEFFGASYSKYINIFPFALSNDDLESGLKRLGQLASAVINKRI